MQVNQCCTHITLCITFGMTILSVQHLKTCIAILKELVFLQKNTYLGVFGAFVHVLSCLYNCWTNMRKYNRWWGMFLKTKIYIFFKCLSAFLTLTLHPKHRFGKKKVNLSFNTFIHVCSNITYTVDGMVYAYSKHS